MLLLWNFTRLLDISKRTCRTSAKTLHQILTQLCLFLDSENFGKSFAHKPCFETSLVYWTSLNDLDKSQNSTLRQISNWPPYKIWYYVTYLINKSKVWLFLFCTHQSIDLQKENTYSCTKIAYVLALLVHGMVVVVFGRNVFFVNCVLWKTLNRARMSIAERAQAVRMMRAGTPIRQICAEPW